MAIFVLIFFITLYLAAFFAQKQRLKKAGFTNKKIQNMKPKELLRQLQKINNKI